MHAREIPRARIELEHHACTISMARYEELFLRCSCTYQRRSHKTMYYRESWQNDAFRRKTRYVVIGVICLNCNLVVLEGNRNAQASLPEA